MLTGLADSSLVPPGWGLAACQLRPFPGLPVSIYREDTVGLLLTAKLATSAQGVIHVCRFTRGIPIGRDDRSARHSHLRRAGRVETGGDGTNPRCFDFAERLLRAHRKDDLLRAPGEVALLRLRRDSRWKLRLRLTGRTDFTIVSGAAADAAQTSLNRRGRTSCARDALVPTTCHALPCDTA